MNQQQDILVPGASAEYDIGASYDEMRAMNGSVRPHWQKFIAAFDKMGGESMERCRQEARRMFRENGVSYNVHGDPTGHQRAWELDPIPLIISNEDWVDIEAGLVQRAELMNLILSDLYGPRQLIQQGLLPAELVFAHEGFLQACDQFGQPTGMKLIDFAVDLARGPDARMWVLRDYTQSPAGIGYALENRTVMSRILPQFFQEQNIHRMSFFFRTIRAALNNLPIRRREQPRIVILTPGPYSELYFEHAYLASYLGYPLVQGDDLTVREGKVWLKTLDGLQPVDVIIRRVSDHFCDPLELAEDSLLGVAGLLQAARLGNVIIVNPVGSGVLENPGLIPFLPGISRYYLGSDLKLPSAATWWCGQEKERQHVLANLQRFVIKPIYRTYTSGSIFGSSLSTQQLDDLRAKILARPHLYVGQEQVSFSTTPCLINGGIQPRHASIRMFVTEHEGRYRVMKGGLTRAARDAGISAPSRHFNHISKDTWILADKPERHISLWLQSTSDEMLAERSGMLASRAAENMYWTGRYAERVEGAARLLRVVLDNLNHSEDINDPTNQQHVQILLQSFTAVTETFPGFLDEQQEFTTEEIGEELRSVMVDGARVGGVANLIDALTRSAYMVRDRWSVDNWRVLDGIKNHWRNVQSNPHSHIISAEYELDELVTSLAAFMGLNIESMTREPGWLMLDCGRRIERGMWLIRMIKSLLITGYEEMLEHMVLESFLSTHESLITHRRRYRSYLQMESVLQVVVMDEGNPRSLSFQLDRLRRNLERLPRRRLDRRMSAEERIGLEMSTRLKLVDTRELSRLDPDGGYQNLLELTNFIEERLMMLSETLNQYYFSHTQGAQQLAPLRGRGGTTS